MVNSSRSFAREVLTMIAACEAGHATGALDRRDQAQLGPASNRVRSRATEPPARHSSMAGLEGPDAGAGAGALKKPEQRSACHSPLYGDSDRSVLRAGLDRQHALGGAGPNSEPPDGLSGPASGSKTHLCAFCTTCSSGCSSASIACCCRKEWWRVWAS